jgi:hypothetical protein
MSVDGTSGSPSKAALDGPLAKRKRSVADDEEVYMVQVRFANQQLTGTILADCGSLQTKQGPYSASSSACVKDGIVHSPGVKHSEFIAMGANSTLTSDALGGPNTSKHVTTPETAPDMSTSNHATTRSKSGQHLSPLGRLDDLPPEIRDEIYKCSYRHVPLSSISQAIHLDLERLPEARQHKDFEWPRPSTCAGRDHFDFLASWFSGDNISGPHSHPSPDNVAHNLVLRGSCEDRPHWFMCACIASCFGFGLVLYPSVGRPDKSDLDLPFKRTNEASPDMFEFSGIPDQWSNSEFNDLLYNTTMGLFFMDSGTARSRAYISLQDSPSVNALIAAVRGYIESDEEITQITIRPGDGPQIMLAQTELPTQNRVSRNKITQKEFSDLLHGYNKAPKDRPWDTDQKKLKADVFIEKKTST